MSEFECRFGHLMRPSSMFCEECQDEGRMREKVVRMDGLSSSEWNAREAYLEENPIEEEEDELGE